MSSDPKQEHAEKKPQLQLIPKVALEDLARAMEQGAAKYGKWNWRITPVEGMTYLGAILRHAMAWQSGEDIDPESPTGNSHLAAIMACCSILRDAQEHGTLIDNRPPRKGDDGTLPLPFTDVICVSSSNEELRLVREFCKAYYELSNSRTLFDGEDSHYVYFLIEGRRMPFSRTEMQNIIKAAQERGDHA